MLAEKSANFLRVNGFRLNKYKKSVELQGEPATAKEMFFVPSKEQEAKES